LPRLHSQPDGDAVDGGGVVAGALLVARGRLSLGGLVAFSAYLARATAPAQTLLGVYVAARRARVSVERVRGFSRNRRRCRRP
jgi:ATP-binding cassette subfamily B protein